MYTTCVNVILSIVSSLFYCPGFSKVSPLVFHFSGIWEIWISYSRHMSMDPSTLYNSIPTRDKSYPKLLAKEKEELEWQNHKISWSYRSIKNRKTENAWLLVPYSTKANHFCELRRQQIQTYEPWTITEEICFCWIWYKEPGVFCLSVSDRSVVLEYRMSLIFVPLPFVPE